MSVADQQLAITLDGTLQVSHTYLTYGNPFNSMLVDLDVTLKRGGTTVTSFTMETGPNLYPGTYNQRVMAGDVVIYNVRMRGNTVPTQGQTLGATDVTTNRPQANFAQVSWSFGGFPGNTAPSQLISQSVFSLIEDAPTQAAVQHLPIKADGKVTFDQSFYFYAFAVFGGDLVQLYVQQMRGGIQVGTSTVNVSYFGSDGAFVYDDSVTLSVLAGDDLVYSVAVYERTGAIGGVPQGLRASRVAVTTSPDALNTTAVWYFTGFVGARVPEAQLVTTKITVVPTPKAYGTLTGKRSGNRVAFDRAN